MDKSIKELIEIEYGLKVKYETAGPRQFVAETHIIETDEEIKYFAKIIKYTKYVDRTIESLPILEELHKSGIKNINYPLKTTSGELNIRHEEQIIILFNYIDAKQTFDFDLAKFGALIARIHTKASYIKAKISKESFNPLYLQDFPEMFNKALKFPSDNEIVNELKSFLLPFENEIWQDWESFLAICRKCQAHSFNLLLTHGDAVGNVLKNDTEIYIVDWDDIKLAPAERDTWFLTDKPEFLAAYSGYFPSYKVDQLTYSYYLYNRYWEDLLGFIEEILSDKSDEHKKKNLQQLKNDCFEWLRPLIHPREPQSN